MSETLSIEKSNALKAYEDGTQKEKALLCNLFGKKVFQKNIMERIRTFGDVCEEMGVDIDDYACDSKDADQIAANALRQWLLIVRCFNEGKEPDWTNSDQSKYSLWLQRDTSAASGWSLHGVDLWFTFANAGARQHFLNREHAKYCAANPEFFQIFCNYFI